MPSVAMRRSTRVFVPKSVVKDADVVRVLRSGKQLTLEAGGGGKQGKRNTDEWFEELLDDDSGDVVSNRPCYLSSSDWRSNGEPERDVEMINLDVKENSISATNESRNSKFKAVYNRKRRRSQTNDDRNRLYGSHYVRKKRRSGETGSSLNEIRNRERNSELGLKRRELVEHSALEVSGRLFDSIPVTTLSVIVEFSPNSARWFSCFLVSILNFMRRFKLRLPELAAFVCSEPIVGVFSRHGIRFLLDSLCMTASKHDHFSFGFCQIFGAREFVPLFSVDFSAIPLLFVNLHSSVSLRSLFLPDILQRFLKGWIHEIHGVTDNEKNIVHVPTEKSIPESNVEAHGSFSLMKRNADFVSGDTFGFAGNSFFSKYGTNSRNVRRKRSSKRSKRVRFSSITYPNANNQIKVDQNGDKLCHSLNSHLVRVGDCGKSHTKPARKSPCSNVKEVKSTLAGSNQSVDSLCCSATVLVIESDKCYRVEGVKVMLECFSSKIWYVVVKKQGLTKYMHKAQDTMRPQACNRFTHALIWTGEDGWKLEFTDREDWSIFKEIYKECVTRNVKVQSAKTIPVPGVQEVPDYVEGECVPFMRPDSYITMHKDEVARALGKRTANYDIDAADEEWLNKLNKSLCDGNDGAVENVSVEKFEQLIDVFERAAYQNPGAAYDETKAMGLCTNLGRKDIMAAVYQYWHKKRKQKREPLVRVFQCSATPSKKVQGVQEKVLRKKRSFKKQATRAQRGKDRVSLEALAAVQEQDSAKAAQVLEEARSKVKKSSEMAAQKRKRAEILMANAELATYRALMAVRIADGKQLAESAANSSDSFVL